MLLKDWPTVFDIVRKLNTDVSLPIFCKIRLLPNLAEVRNPSDLKDIFY